jgi:hypothetical protein
MVISISLFKRTLGIFAIGCQCYLGLRELPGHWTTPIVEVEAMATARRSDVEIVAAAVAPSRAGTRSGAECETQYLGSRNF